MNRITLAFGLSIAFFFSCKPAADYKVIREEIVQLHDSVMMETETAFKNKRALDTLFLHLDSLKKLNPSLDTLKEKNAIQTLRLKLDTADATMNDWMHQFEVEKGNKSDAEAVAYFEQEKVKIKSIDSLFNAVLSESGAYLKKMKGQ